MFVFEIIMFSTGFELAKREGVARSLTWCTLVSSDYCSLLSSLWLPANSLLLLFLLFIESESTKTVVWWWRRQVHMHPTKVLKNSGVVLLSPSSIVSAVLISAALHSENKKVDVNFNYNNAHTILKNEIFYKKCFAHDCNGNIYYCIFQVAWNDVFIEQNASVCVCGIIF